MNKPGRNDPCPCGSARKFKLCHGALQIASDTPKPAARHCGDCTACCEGWAEGEVRGHRMHPGRPCHFLRPPGERTPGLSSCAIYDERPQSPCRNFVCGWLASGSPFPDAFRPDGVGVIIVPMRWRGRPAHVLLSAGNDPGAEMLDWMQAHAVQTGSPFFYAQKGERIGFGPPEFQLEMLARLQRGERLW